MADQIKIQKSILYPIVITFVITLALSYFVFAYYPNMQHQSSVNDYKKSLFDSVLCQYNCPLTNQTIQNKTQLLPDQKCAESCTISLRATQNNTKVCNYELENDDLTLSIEKAVKNCQLKAVNQTALKVNNELFFPCVVQELQALKTKYNYLD